jgi:hypothetical protein
VATADGSFAKGVVGAADVECSVPSDHATGESLSDLQVNTYTDVDPILKLVSQPALRIARALGLRKGSLASRYTQLYISFGISCLVHQYQMFNVTRRGMGEFIFFMSQPIAISVEDLVQWVWRLYIKKTPTDRRWGTLFSTSVGYCWVFLWFSFSLPIYVKGCRDAGIVRDAIFGNRLFDFGVWAASQVMQQG